jgi:ribosome recycling factor
MRLSSGLTPGADVTFSRYELRMKTENQAAPSGQNFASVKDLEASLKVRMEKALSDLQHEMAGIRTGRASLSILDNIRVDYYGTPTPLNQVANLHVPEPSLITITPWDPSQIGPIEKAIRASDLGLNPANDGKLIRLPIPPLTEERRKDLVKKLHGAAEHHRVALRNIRRDGNDAVKKLLKDKKITEDEDKRAHDEIQKMTDGYIQKLDISAKTKEKEILEIR